MSNGQHMQNASQQQLSSMHTNPGTYQIPQTTKNYNLNQMIKGTMTTVAQGKPIPQTSKYVANPSDIKSFNYNEQVSDATRFKNMWPIINWLIFIIHFK